jgi:hypothetical protein
LEAALAMQMNSTSKTSTDDYYTELTPNAVTSAVGIILEIIDNKIHIIYQTAKDFYSRTINYGRPNSAAATI